MFIPAAPERHKCFPCPLPQRRLTVTTSIPEVYESALGALWMLGLVLRGVDGANFGFDQLSLRSHSATVVRHDDSWLVVDATLRSML